MRIEVVEELMTCTKTEPNLGSKSSDSANCLLALNYEVKFIGNFGKNGFSNFRSEVETLDRVPTTQDLIKYLKEGYHILGNADYYRLERDKWTLGPGHVVFIHGFARNKNWPQDLLYIYINDPDYMYNSTNSLKYQQVLISKVAYSEGLPPFTSKLFLEGGSFANLKSRAFLDSILIFKLK